MVSAADADLLSARLWFIRATKTVAYAVNRGFKLHRDVVDRISDQKWPLIDHKNGNGMDNRRDNLRPCTHTENMRNRTKSPKTGTSSRFKGVWFRHGSWRAGITVGGESISLGIFADEVAAARQYDRAARVFFGKFARTNKAMGRL